MPRSARRETWRTSAQLTFIRGASAALQGLTLSVAARKAGPAELGVSLATLAVATVAVPLVDLGVTPFLTRAVAERTLTDEEVRARVRLRIGVALVAGVVAAAVAAAAGAPATAGLFVAGESIVLVHFGVLLARRRLELFGAVLLLQRLTTVLALVAFGDRLDLVDALAAGAALGAVAIVAATDAGALLRRPAAGSGVRLPALAREGSPFLVHGIGAQLAGVDTPIVGQVAGSTVAGVYGLPSRLTNAIGLVVTSVAAAILPATASAKDDPAALRRLVKDGLWLMGAMAVALGVGAVLAEPIVDLLFGSEFEDAVGPFRLILVAVGVGGLNNLVSSLLQGLGFAGATGRAVLGGTVAGLGLVALGAALGDEVGAAAGLCGMQLAILVLLADVWRRSR